MGLGSALRITVVPFATAPPPVVGEEAVESEAEGRLQLLTKKPASARQTATAHEILAAKGGLLPACMMQERRARWRLAQQFLQPRDERAVARSSLRPLEALLAANPG